MNYPPSQNTLVSLVRAGELVAGKYRVDRVLGQGAMGVVMAATHTELQQDVAIKFMLGNASRDPTLVERFRREARVSARIRSEHVARVLDVGKLDNGTPYIVMEFLQGCDVAAELEQRGPLPLKEVADYLLQASEALAEAHALGIVHRDLKPSNFFLQQRRDGSRVLKILDFGISKIGEGSSNDAALTATHSLMGSPLYMAPEQIRNSKNVDARSDVWSLGVILYELLSGRPPFQAEQVGGLLAAIMTDAYPSIRSLNANVPQEVDALINRCLQKDRDKRLANVVELARGLKPFASSAGKVVADRVSRTSLHAVGQTTAQPPSSDPIQIPMQTGFGAAVTKNPTARAALPWFGGLAFAALTGATAFWYWRDTLVQPVIEAQGAISGAPEPAASPNQESLAQVPAEKAPNPEPKPIAVAELPKVEPIAELPKVEPIAEPPQEKAVVPPAPKVVAAKPQRPKVAKPLTTAFFDRTPRPAPTPAKEAPKAPEPPAKPAEAPSVDPLSGRK